jgi:hypothetical protein
VPGSNAGSRENADPIGQQVCHVALKHQNTEFCTRRYVGRSGKSFGTFVPQIPFGCWPTVLCVILLISSEQTSENGLKKARFKVTGPNWTMKKSGGVAEVLYFVGVPDGI